MSRLREVNVFAAVGLAATAVHVGVGLAAEWLGAAPLVANTIGFAAALGVSYVGNARLTFRVQVGRWTAVVRYAALSGLGFLLNQAIVAGVVYGMGYDYVLALVLVVLTVPPFTFVAAKYWALQDRRG